MLILNSKKAIYIHIHKTGGESIEHALGKYCAWNDIALDSENLGTLRDYVRKFGIGKHSPARHVARIMGMDQWKQYFSFATVRDPYARTASLYGFLSSRCDPRIGEINFPVNEPYARQRAWVESGECPKKDHWGWPAVRAYLATRGAPHPFSEFIRHPLLLSGEPAFKSQFSQLSNPRGNALLVKRVVKLESLASEWPQLCEKLGVPATPLTHKNATPNESKRPIDQLFADPADVAFVNELYADDFKWFGYQSRDAQLQSRVGNAPVSETV
jgi:hypothetical protein